MAQIKKKNHKFSLFFLRKTLSILFFTFSEEQKLGKKEPLRKKANPAPSVYFRSELFFEKSLDPALKASM